MSDKLDRIETVLRSMYMKLEEVDRKVQELLEDYDDEEVTNRTASRSTPDSSERFIEEEEIYKYGQKIPYSRLKHSVDIELFRDFVSYVRLHADHFSPKEVDYANFADKNFSDIRLSDNTRRILGQAYVKAYGKNWAFNFERGLMRKYKGQIAWEWADGSKD